jgi:hypothetical protein
MAALLGFTALGSLLRSALVQRDDHVPASHIKHLLGTDVMLIVIGLGLCVGSLFARLEGMTGDVIIGTALGTIVLLGITGIYALHMAAQPNEASS